MPRFWSVETGLLFLVAAALIGRSVSDIWMIQNATVVESTIIHMNKDKFKSALLKYLAALPMVCRDTKKICHERVFKNLHIFRFFFLFIS